jgi:hypothetical protein
MGSAWLDHVKETMKKNKGLPFKEVLKLAKTTYKEGEKMTSKVVKTAKYAVTGKKTRKHRKGKTAKKHRKSKSHRRNRKSRK